MAIPTPTYELITPDGVTFNLTNTGLTVRARIGDGMGLPAITHDSHTVYNQPGQVLDKILIGPRLVTITLNAFEDPIDSGQIHTIRAALFDALRWNRVAGDPPAPSTLRYTFLGNSADLHVYYLSDVTEMAADYVNLIGLRLIAYDPMWYATSSTTTTMELSKNLSVAHVVGLEDGEWSALAGGTNGTSVYAMTTAPDGTLYIGGDFTTAGGVAAAKVARWNGTVWSALGAGLPGTVRALAVGPDGSVYAAGDFPIPHNVMKWNGAAWSDLGNPSTNNATIYALAVAPDGTLYAGGDFTSINGVDANRVAKWNGAAWSALGAGLDANEALTLAVAPNGYLYIGGTFVVAGGVTVNAIAYWDGSAYHALETGADNAVQAILFAPDGTLYAAGRFHTLGTTSAMHVGSWNGSHWYALGSGVNDEAYALAVTDDGTLYVGGAFTTAGGVAVADRMAQWTGTTWAALDIDLPSTPSVWCLTARGENFYIGFSTSGTAVASDICSPVNAGDADAWPVITFTGPGYVQQILNRTTGKKILLSLQINAGETVTLDLSPGAKKLVSDWRGDLMPYATLLPLGDLATFALAPGEVAPSGVNTISLLMTGTGGGSSASLEHTNTYLSLDAAVQ
jgi:hypothetical protein